MTPLQTRLVELLTEHGPSTSGDLGALAGVSARSASNSLQFLRGHGAVNDGSVIYTWPGGRLSCVHHPVGPLVWNLGPAEKHNRACPMLKQPLPGTPRT
jgi:hypothetical protein